MFAVRNRHVEIVRYLISKGADVDAVNGEGKGVLAVAEQKGVAEIVQLLRNAGAK